MKNLILKMTVIGMLTFFTNVLKGQTWDIVCDNTQVCSGITVDVYDAFNNIIVSGVALPGGTSKFGGGVIGTCQSIVPAYVVFTEGTCSFTVNINSVYNCGAGGTTCTCSCITSGTSYQVDYVTTPPLYSGCTRDLYIKIQ
jgi:hypothetical protein